MAHADTRVKLRLQQAALEQGLELFSGVVLCPFILSSSFLPLIKTINRITTHECGAV
jgi:hypothetical protein